MRILVSVRNLDEALVAAHGGADFIDLKEPAAGALGGLPIDTIAAIVTALRGRGITLPISATIGEPPRERVLEHVAAVAACGVDYVKVGLAREPGSHALLDALAACRRAVVPVFIADDGIDAALVAHALQRRRFPALMLDTDDKRGGSLLQRVPQRDLSAFVATVRDGGAMAGLAGALRLRHVPELLRVAPDFAGFRSAVCAGDRSAALDEVLVRALAAQVKATGASVPTRRYRPVAGTVEVDVR